MRRLNSWFFLARAILLLGAGCCWAGEVQPSAFFESKAQASLAQAAADGDVDAMQAALSNGAVTNAKGVDNMTALLWAMLHQSKKGVAWLLTQGADPNVIFTQDGVCATSLAAKLPDAWFLKEVQAHGGDLNIRNPLNGRTPLVEALVSGRDENVHTLLSAGVNVNTLDVLGLTPVVEAAAAQRYELVYDMLLAGADPGVQLQKWKGKTLLTFIRNSRTPPESPAYQWRLKVVDLLRQKGLDVDHGE